MSKARSQRGMTLVELIVAFTILLVLTSMAVPLARSNVQRIKERQLREALHDMRAAIDKYKDLADGGKLGIQKVDAYGYPETLKALVDGVKGSGQAADVKLKFLRRIPRDPMTNSYEWGVRSMQDDPKSQGWGGQNVFDVYSKSDQAGSDGDLMLNGEVRTRLSANSPHKGRFAPVRLASRGFTLIEMMIVMAIIVILIAVAVPFYQKAIIRAKESVLHNNLFAMRSAIDEYTFDKQKAPQDLHDLVTDGYLREVPRDPIAQRNDTWKVIMETAGAAVSSTEPGIFDVRSGSDKISLDGTKYSDW